MNTDVKITQQTLDDVMAGIPARDAEIEALRKEIETLRAKQPVSGADGLPQGWRIVPEKIPMKGLDDAIAWMRPAMNQAGRDLAYCLTGAWGILLDSVTPPGHLPDTTKMVEQAGALSGQNRSETRKDAVSGGGAQPSGNSGEFKADDQIEGLLAAIQDYGRWKYAEAKGRAEPDLSDVRAAWDEVYGKVQSLAQQDADKVDVALAEMVHAMFRSGNSVPVTRIMIDRKQYESAIDAARKEVQP